MNRIITNRSIALSYLPPINYWYCYRPTTRSLSEIFSPAPSTIPIINKRWHRTEAAENQHHKTEPSIMEKYPCHVYHPVPSLYCYRPMTQSLPQIFARYLESKMIIYMSGLVFKLVLFNLHKKATLVTDITKIHKRGWIQTLSAYHLVFWLSLVEPPKCA